MNEMTSASVREYLGMLRRRWYLILLLPLLAAVGGYGLAAMQERTYSATTTLIVNSGPAGFGTGDVWSANQLTRTYSRLVVSRPVLGSVVERLGLGSTAQDLEGSVEATAEPETQIIQVSATDPNPARAAQLSTATGTAFIEWLAALRASTTGEGTRALRASIEDVQRSMNAAARELAALRADSAPPGEDRTDRIETLETLHQQYQDTYANLLELQQRLEVEQIGSGNQVRLIAPAEVPTNPNGYPASLYGGLAAFLGLGAAGMLVVLLEKASDRVRTPGDVSRLVGTAVLASLPRGRRGSALELLEAPQSRFSEAIRALRVQLQFRTRAGGLGSLVVTSAGPDGGTTQVATNLAVAYAQSGHRVVLVDGHLRTPRLDALIGGASSAGLSNLLSDPVARVDELLVPGPVRGLHILPAGPRPVNPNRIGTSALDGADGEPEWRDGRNGRGRTDATASGVLVDLVVSPSELLTRERVEQVLAGLRASTDVVVVDAPPLLGMSDAMVLAAAADHLILVAGAGRTRVEQLQAARRNLELIGVAAAGVVLCDAEQGQPLS